MAGLEAVRVFSEILVKSCNVVSDAFLIEGTILGFTVLILPSFFATKKIPIPSILYSEWARTSLFSL